jgi:predicted transcriptional regulator
MKPIDLRNTTFALIRQTLSDRIKAVYEAWMVHGPATTRELATKSGIDLLNVRPRTTDLCALGLVELAGAERSSEGVYQVVTEDHWNTWQKDQVCGQQQLL